MDGERGRMEVDLGCGNRGKMEKVEVDLRCGNRGRWGGRMWIYKVWEKGENGEGGGGFKVLE